MYTLFSLIPPMRIGNQEMLSVELEGKPNLLMVQVIPCWMLDRSASVSVHSSLKSFIIIYFCYFEIQGFAHQGLSEANILWVAFKICGLGMKFLGENAQHLPSPGPHGGNSKNSFRLRLDHRFGALASMVYNFSSRRPSLSSMQLSKIISNDFAYLYLVQSEGWCI